jgi:hypothetical protein
VGGTGVGGMVLFHDDFFDDGAVLFLEHFADHVYLVGDDVFESF